MNFMYTYAVIIWLMAILVVVSDLKNIKKVLTLLKNTDLSSYKLYDYSKTQKIIFSSMLLLSSLSTFLGFDDLVYVIINAAIILICFVEVFACSIIMKMYYNDKNIIYEGEIYRIKKIKSIKKVKKHGRNHEVTTFDGNVFNVYDKTAAFIQKLIDERN